MSAQHHSECGFCRTVAFLRPVEFFPGLSVKVTTGLCRMCRVSWRDTPYGTLVTTWLHHIDGQKRAVARTAPREEEYE